MDIVTIILISLIIILAFVSYSHFFGAPWIPTPRRTVINMLNLARIRPGEVIYDLGSGDGRIIIDAARNFGAIAIGIEIDPIRFLWTKILIYKLRLQDSAEVLLGNFFNKDLSRADIIMIYLLQDTNLKLINKFVNELKPGTRIVTNTFTLPGFEILRQDKKAQIYVYRV